MQTTDKTAKHTPGPLAVRSFSIDGMYEIWAAERVGGALSRADALIFAAAPELLEALQIARRWMHSYLMDDHPDAVQVDAAIAAAEGR